MKWHLRNLEGLEILSVNNERAKLKIDKTVDKEKIKEFVSSFPNDFQLSFFDNFHPQISDPGAYVWVQKLESEFAFMLANHGWSSEWKTIGFYDLVDYIDKNKQYTSDYFEIYPLKQVAVIGERH